MARLSKKNIDVKIATIISLQAQIKALKKELDENKDVIKALCTEKPEIREIIAGIDYEAEKIPVHNGAQNYNFEKAEKILAAITNRRAKAGVVVTVKSIDGEKFENLVTEGYITKEMADECREDSWSSKMVFRQKAEKAAKDAKVAKDEKVAKATKVAAKG